MMRVYSLYDRKLKSYGQLILQRNNIAVQRDLLGALRGAPEWMPAKYPGDFDLHHLAEFDEETGVFTKFPAHSLVCNLLELVEGEVAQDGPSLAREG